MWLLNPYWYTRQFSAPVSNYLDQVIAADVAAGNLLGLEDATKTAYATFIDNLIVDGYLGVSGGTISQASSVIKASPIMAGARTLAGALVPLVGAAPTNFNFVAGDYDRKTGLAGNGSTKYLNSNFKISQYTTGENLHLGIYGTSGLNLPGLSGFGRPIGVFRNDAYTRHYIVVDVGSGGSGWGSFTGVANQSSGHYISTRLTGQSAVRYLNGSFNANLNSDNSTPSDHPVGIFAVLGSGTGAGTETTQVFGVSPAKIAFYHIGEGLSAGQVASLNTRRANLFNTFAAVIP